MSARHPDTTDPLSQEGLVLDHRFRLDRFLGAGSVHTVFAATDLLESQQVCVKIPRRELRNNSGFTLRYRRDVLNVIAHRNSGWLTPLQLGEHDGSPFQVLPLVAGETLPAWYQALGDPDALLELLKLALYHLGQLHRVTGSLHGAIKPENLLVDKSNAPIFLDLVATGRLEDQFTDKARTGEPVYFSPEQLVGERAGPPSDIYSLGLVLYTALAHRHPFSGLTDLGPSLGHPERLLASMLWQLQGRPPNPSSYREDVPRWADRFLARCLLPRPEDRFAQPEEALDWLRHHARSSEAPSAEHRALPPAGREQEMAFLMECLLEVVGPSPRGHLIRLHGAPGVGKSRCSEWLKEQARHHGVRVVDVYRAPESGLHLQSVANALRRSLPASSERREPAEARPVVESVIEAALDGPLLLLLDDIAQADETLVRLLEELSTVLADLPVLVILSDEGPPFRSPTVASFLETLHDILILPPLDRRAVANLIEEVAWSPPSAGLANWVHRVSEGNALAARLLVDYLLAGGFLREEITLDWATSPCTERPDLATLLSWKLDGVSPTTRTLLETGAVLGDSFNLTTLQAITYRDPEEVDLAISEAVKASLLEDRSSSRALGGRSGATTYGWSHPLFRHTLRDALPPRRRQRIHRLAAAFYSRGEPEPTKLAYHFLQSGDIRELYHWGIQAASKARALGRRGESNYWLHVLLSKVDPDRWLGPDLDKARQEIARDQSDRWDLADWKRWFLALAGRATAEPDTLESHHPTYAVQVLLDAPWPWPVWQRGAVCVLAEISERVRSRRETIGPYLKAIVLLRSQWFARAENGEPFPEGTD